MTAPPAAPVQVEFFFAPTSRYSYLASTQMLKLQLETGCRVDWYPLHNKDLVDASGHDFYTHGRKTSVQYDAAWRKADAEAWAELYGVPFRDPAGLVIPDPRRLALACVIARNYDAGQVYARRLFQAVYVDGLSPLDDDALCAMAEEVAGIEAETFRRHLDEPETEAAHKEIVTRARTAGCFGVPSFVVQGRVIWGNDRLPLLRHAIAQAKAR